MPNLVNPYSFGAGSVAATFIGVSQLSTDTNVYTFTGEDVSAAAASRVVAVGVMTNDATAQSISSVTIGGNTATLAADSGSTNTGRLCAIYYFNLAAGTTATIVVTFSGSMSSCAIAKWAVYPVSPTPTGAVGANVAPDTQAIATPLAVTTGGFAVAVSFHKSAHAQQFLWSGVDTPIEDFDAQVGDTGFVGGAMHMTLSQTTSQAIRSQWTDSVNGCIAAAAWGP